MNGRQVRAYSALLRLYPRRFRTQYRHEMTVLFAQQLADARSTEGNLGVVRLWIRSVFDLVATAPTEHLEHDVLVAQPVVGFDQPRTKPDRAERTVWIIAALAPAFLVLFLQALAPHFLEPMLKKPPETLGVPTGSVILGVGAIWCAIGVVIIGKTSRVAVRLAAFLVFITPATISIVLGPAILLVMQNLTATVGE